jgi:hypothetical protein
MKSKVSVTYSDLLDAFDWVSAGAPGENSAYICFDTGKIYFASSLIELDEELPEDIGDTARYLEVPHKYDFDLGKNLVFRFAEDHLPDDWEKIEGFFHRSGAYRKFKDLLDTRNALDSWHEYEAEAVEKALREWSEDNELPLEE